MGDFLTFDQVLVQNLAFLVQIWIQQVKFVQKTKLKPKKAYKCDGDTKSPIHHEACPKMDIHGRFYEFGETGMKFAKRTVLQHEVTSCKLAPRASLRPCVLGFAFGRYLPKLT